MNTGLWNMDSGLAAARRPGMTEGWTGQIPSEQGIFRDLTGNCLPGAQPPH